MTDRNPAKRPVIKKHRGPSAIWILPLLAALIAGWLVYKSYRDAGIMIEIVFDSAEGLEANKTRLLYRGLPGGVVKDFTLNEDLKSVTALVSVDPRAEPWLNDGTQFWLVKPQISLSGVRGLETLLSGYYIGVSPGEGIPSRHFTSLKEPPPPEHDEDGLYLTLFSDHAGSLHRGSRIYLRDIDVGEVLDYQLTEDGRQVRVEVFIDQNYAHLIQKHTRFWNASGLKIDANLPEIKVQIGSLASLIAGGIQLSTPDPDTVAAVNGDQFRLYPDFESAEQGIEIRLVFPGTTQLSIGTEIISRGIQVGRVTAVTLTDDFKELHASVLIDPRARHLLRSESQFWLKKAELSLEQLGNIKRLIRGNHIELFPGGGVEKFHYVAQLEAPSRAQVVNGLPITLVTEQLGSVTRGSPVLYRQLKVGEVSGFELTEDGKNIQIFAVIEPRYQSLVTNASRFWNSSGIRFHASLKQVGLETESIRSLLRGGISFFTPDKADAKPAERDQKYRLHDDFDLASNQGRLLLTERADKLQIRLLAPELGSLAVGSPISYKQLKVGQVSHYSLSKNGQNVVIYALIDKQYRKLVTSHSRFWNASGVEARISFKGLSVNTQSLESIVNGGIAFETLPKGKRIEANKLFRMYDSREQAKQQGKTITLLFPPGKSVSAGADLRYQGLTVGEVEAVTLAAADGSMKVTAVLYQEGHFLAKQGSRFWIVEPQINLSGVRNAGNLLSGNHIAVLPGKGKASTRFQALGNPPTDTGTAGLVIELTADLLGSLQSGSPIYYRQVPVGQVQGYDLSPDGNRVIINARIQQRYAHLVKSSSRFWNISGLRASFGLLDGLELDTESIESLLTGGIAFDSPPGGENIAAGTRFPLMAEAPDSDHDDS